MNDATDIPNSMGVSDPATDKPSPLIQELGSWVGRYKLLKQIGEGGCGVVFMAEQEEPLRRMVALKVIKPGMDTKSVIARFEAERQALALMDHPNIAHAFDGGATTGGRPYFVMELVQGLKITDYCDQHSLSTTERLRLFIEVCGAVQHAHQKGIIHRDIKPSNILITTSANGKPVPKIIDFGIAKAITGQRLTDKTLFTAFEMLVGTPAYMSPEQAELTSIDIDTRSDIYSMGVLLYELLTGTTPFNMQELLKFGLDEVRRVIRTRDPVRPSTRLSAMPTPDLISISQQRRSESPTLIREVRNDLDWIVMKALEKDRNRRYATANGLALDVRRFLEKEEVLARPPSAAYKLQKLFLRNKLVFIGLGLIFSLLVIALTVTTHLVIRQQRDLKLSAAMQLEAKANKYVRDNKPAEAQAAIRESLAIRRRYLDGEPPTTEAIKYVIGTMMGSMHELDEAIGVLDQILTPPVLRRPECAELIAIRAELYGREGKWQHAAPDAMQFVKQQPDNNYAYHLLAPLLVATTNLNAYQDLCSTVLKHFSNTTNLFVAEQAAKDCLILPSAGVDSKVVAVLAEFAVTNGKDNRLAYHFAQCCHALAQYRLGNYHEAETWAQECAKNPFPPTQAEAYAVLAMAQHELGHQDNARHALSNCNHVVESKLPKLGQVLGKEWKDWIIANALQSEAKLMIEGEPSPAAPPANLPR